MRNFRRPPPHCLHIPTALLASLLLTHCTTSAPPRQPPRPATVPALETLPAKARVYQVDAAQSLLQVLVYRGGKLASLGHNHVIASHELTGSVALGEPLTTSRFDIRLPVDTLTVDEADLRRQAGADFQADVPQNARDGTRRNMLSAALLDAEHFPVIQLRSADVVGMPDGRFDVGVDIDIKGQTHRFRVPVQFASNASQLSATGEIELLQSDLGLTPFTALLGALAVENRMIVRFRFLAVAP